MTGSPLVVVGGSAGAIEALRIILPALPRDFAAPIAIVLHRGPVEIDDRLARVLGAGSQLEVKHAEDGELLAPGFAYIAHAGRNMTIFERHVRLVHAPPLHRWQPSIDALFTTAAHGYAAETIGVILSGLLDDGVTGLAAIGLAGGHPCVQTPDDALFSDLPARVYRAVPRATVLPASALAQALVDTVARVRAGIP